MYKVLIQKEEVCGPPPYLTTDWRSARESVRKLEALHPTSAVTGHGSHMSGHDLSSGLMKLAKDFDEVALPDFGKYVRESDKEDFQ